MTFHDIRTNLTNQAYPSWQAFAEDLLDALTPAPKGEDAPSDPPEGT